jgi:hypothetical protein
MTESTLPKKTLVWHKLPIDGFIPSGREGHSSVGANMKMYVFGGMETGRRVNTMQVLDIMTGQWTANAVGNRDLRIDAEVHKDATNEDDISAHKNIGKAESIDENADFDPDAMNSSNPNIPTPRCHHAAALIEFDVDVSNPIKKGGKKNKATAPAVESGAPVTKRMQLMILHGGEGTVIEEDEKAEDLSAGGRTVHFNNEGNGGNPHHGSLKGHHTGHSSRTSNGSSSSSSRGGGKSRKHSKQTLRDTQFSNTLSVEEHEKSTREREGQRLKHTRMEESRQMTEMDRKLERLPRSQSMPGGVCVDDTIQNYGHKTAGLRVDRQKSEHLLRVSVKTHASAHNQQAVLSTQSVVPLEDVFALDVNNGEWIRFETVMGPLPRKGHSLSVAPVSRQALGMGASGDALDPERILANRDRRLGRLRHHQAMDAEEDEDEPKPDPRVQSVLLFGGYNNPHEAYSNTVHLATVDNFASSYINLNQLVRDERALHAKPEHDGDSDSDSEASTAQASQASKNGKSAEAAFQLRKDMVKQQNSIKWRVVHTTGTPPAPRYRHTATVVRHRHLGSASEGGSVACSLVVFGGLGRGNIPLNDVHVLDLDTLEWTEVRPHTSGANDAWPSHGLFGHTALPVPIKGMWLKRSETEGELEGDDVFGNVPLSAAARMAARSAASTRPGSPGGRQQQLGLIKGSDAFQEASPEEESSLFQDVLVVYGGSGGSEAHNRKNWHKKKKAQRHSRQHGHAVAIDDGDAEGEEEEEEEEEDELGLEEREAIAKESGASHVTRVLDLTSGHWRELKGSITYPAQRVNHTLALVKGWAPGNPARIAIKVGESHHMTSLPPAPILNKPASGDEGAGAAGAARAAPGATMVGGGGALDGHKQEDDSCAVVFGGSSLTMCPPDIWVMDLNWRVAGVKGFDSHANSRTRDALAQSIEWSKRTQYPSSAAAAGGAGPTGSGSMRHLNAAMHHHENHTLHMADPAHGATHIDLEVDPNYNTLGPNTTAAQRAAFNDPSANGTVAGGTGTINFSHLHLSPAEIEAQYEELTNAFRRVKKERAHAELQISKERQRSFECLLRADRAENSLRQVNKEYAQHRARAAIESKALQESLDKQTEVAGKLKAERDELLLEKQENEKVINMLVISAKAQRAQSGADVRGFSVKSVF